MTWNDACYLHSFFFFLIYKFGREEVGHPHQAGFLAEPHHLEAGRFKGRLKLDRDLHPGHPLKSLFSEATNQ
jgi:hypothetical protein